MTTFPVDPAGPPSWQEPLPKEEDRPAESGKAWEAFCWYRDLGSSRSLDKVEQKYNKSRPLLARWSGLYHWVERVQSYDLHQSELTRKAAEDEHADKIKAYRERAGKIGAATADVSLGFLVAAGQRLKALTNTVAGEGKETVADIPITSLPAFLRAAAAVAQISLQVEAESLGVRELETLLVSDKDPEKDPA